jgi:hypothetical protein
MLQGSGLLVDNDSHYFLSPDLNHGFLCNIPERRLEKAILDQAIHDIIRPLEETSANKTKLEVDQSKALAWVFGKEQNFMYSYENICLDLKIDPYYVKELLQMVLKNKYGKVLKLKGSYNQQSHKVSYRSIVGTRYKVRKKRKSVANSAS